MADYSHKNPAEVEKRVIRRTAAMEMKLAGATYEEIAEACGYSSRGAAYKDLQARLAAVENEEAEVASRLRVLQHARLERLLAACWDDATNTGSRNQFRAADLALKIIERQSRLHGTDAPIKQEITVTENLDERISELMKILAAEHEPTVIRGELLREE